jgi:hypothetical protein
VKTPVHNSDSTAKPGESAEEFAKRKEFGEAPQTIPQTAAHSIARAARQIAEQRQAADNAAPMSDAARQAVDKLRKAARIADTSDPPPIEPDDIPFDRNEPEPASAGATP